MKKGHIGLFLITIGLLLMVNSKLNLTGAVISGGVSQSLQSIISLILIIGGMVFLIQGTNLAKIVKPDDESDELSSTKEDTAHQSQDGAYRVIERELGDPPEKIEDMIYIISQAIAGIKELPGYRPGDEKPKMRHYAKELVRIYPEVSKEYIKKALYGDIHTDKKGKRKGDREARREKRESKNDLRSYRGRRTG